MCGLIPDPLSRDRISVVIPARNEVRNLPHVLENLPAGLHEVILVDGHSTDATIGAAVRLTRDAWAEIAGLPISTPAETSTERRAF